MRTCDIKGCGRKHHGRGLCDAHQSRLRRTGRLAADRPIFTAAEGCAVDGCDRRHHSNGHCRPHAWRLKRHGNVRADVPIATWRVAVDLDAEEEL